MSDTPARPARRRLLSAASALALPGGLARAQARPGNWPGAQPVSVVIPYPAGVAADTLVRSIGERLAETTGGRFLAVHRPGASTTVAATFVARQPADGYTFLLGSVTTFCLAPWAYKNPGYDAMRDFTHISALGDAIMMLVANPRWKSLAEFLAEARRRPGELTFASLGVGGTVHVMFLDLMARAGVTLTHVPYGGSPPALTDTVGGRIDVTVAPLVTARSYIDAGRLSVLGVAGDTRAAALPSAPTLAEAGLPGLRSAGWLSLHARTGTPEPIVRTVEDAVKTVLNSPDGSAMLARLSMARMELGSAALGRRIEEESAYYRELMAKAGVVPE
jgi:tripartite-type tricarboxylate transporter receptor subunit TctC